MVEGMKIAWDMGIRRVCLEYDALEVIQQVENLETLEARCNMAYRQVHFWRNQNWNLSLRYVPRKCNGYADVIAKFHQRQLGRIGFGTNHQPLWRLPCLMIFWVCRPIVVRLVPQVDNMLSFV